MIEICNYRKNIPLELRNYRQWLWFRRIESQDRNGRIKVKKIPVSPITMRSTDWNNTRHWADFETAINNLESSGCDGLSFVLNKDDPFLCIDLDNIEMKKWSTFIEDFEDTYVEFSQSGKGLHIFAKGKIPSNFNNQIEQVEMYQENRCIAMTGNTISTKDRALHKIACKQREIDKYFKLYAPKSSVREQLRSYQRIPEGVPSISNIIEIMCKYNPKARALFEGSYSSGDASKDDFCLLLFLNSFTHGNADLMKEIFLQSVLNRSEDRSKRRNELSYLRYLDQSIRKAILVGNQNYWNYNYHRKRGGDVLE